MNCQRTWDMICEGDTEGCFQIKSGLGKAWCQRIKPRNIEELSAVISLVRPGCLKAMEPDSEGKLKSLTQHYADRKNGEELVEFLHPIIDPILQPTYNVIVYQEQAIKIAVAGAGFTPVEADSLRKAMGKKDAELMNKVKAMFLEKAKTYGVLDDDLAMKLISWIEKSNRYSFNKCITPDTIVEDEYGDLKTIEELQIGEKITSPNGLTSVMNKYDNGEKDVVEIELSDGKTIKCTLDHKFLCGDGTIRPLIEIFDKNLDIVVEED